MQIKRLWRRLHDLIYLNDYEMIHSPCKKSMDGFLWQLIAGGLVGVFSGGNFLNGFLIYLGASDELVSYLSVIPSVCGIVLVFFGSLLQKNSHPKKMVILFNYVAKSFLLCIIFVPLLVPKTVAIPIVYFMLVIGYAANALNNLMINNWFVKAIDCDVRGRYYSARQIVAVMLGLIFPLFAAMIVDSAADQYHAFLILYGIAIVIAIWEVFTFKNIDDFEVDTIKEPLKIIDVFRIPLRNKKFMVFVVYMALFYLALYTSAAYKTLYMIRYLNMSYTFINIMGMISSVLQMLIFYKFWGKINDKMGGSFVMAVCIWFYALDIFLWVFATPVIGYITLPLAHMVGAVQGAGFAVGNFSYKYQLIPEKGRSIYDAFYTSIIGVVLVIGPFLGGKIKGFLAVSNLGQSIQFGEFRYLYLVTGILLLLVQIGYYLYLKKTNPQDPALKGENYIDLCRTLFKRRA